MKYLIKYQSSNCRNIYYLGKWIFELLEIYYEVSDG